MASRIFISDHSHENVDLDDLRIPEVREAQAELAREHGIEGFCYWHYWMGNGRVLLDRPMKEIIESGKPDFPFCVAWANHTWSGVWCGEDSRILVEQKYPGKQDYIDHFYYLYLEEDI